MSTWSRIANVFRSRSLDRDIDAELESHFNEARAAGRDPAEVSREFGSRLRAHEAVRDAIVATWLESLVADARFGWRQLGKHKAASAAAILSLALGIGSCTAAFRLIDALFLRPLPVADPGRLYVLSYGTIDDSGKAGTAAASDYPGFQMLRSVVKGEAELMAISDPDRIDVTYGSDADLERAYQQYVSGWTFAEFGLKPALGRLFTEADDLKPGAHPYAVLSYDYWSRRFGRDPRVLGRTLHAHNRVFQIVGVAPEGFTGTGTGTFTDLFIPTMMANADAINNENLVWFTTWVRLHPGVDPERVRQQLRAALLLHRRDVVKLWLPEVLRRVGEHYLSAPVFLDPAAAGFSFTQKTYRRALAILGVLVALVLLIASANVANLMSAQAAARTREMALRVSIGAGKRRLVQLVLVESLLLALVASALGIVFAWWAAPFVVGMINPSDSPARLILPADWRVTSFAVALTFTVTLLFGLAPALRASSVKPASALKGGEDPHARRRLMHVLIAAQVAFCFLVHFVAGLFVSTFERLANEPTGFSSARVLTLETISKAPEPPNIWYQVVQHLRSLPGVESAAVSGLTLMSGRVWTEDVWANGHSPQQYQPAWFLGISPGWFEAMKIPLLDGRDFRPDETYPHVVIVNQAFARHYFDGRSPVGQTIEIPEGKARAKAQIVGLVKDARYNGMREPIQPTVYAATLLPGPTGTEQGTFIVRTKSANPIALASILRQEIPRARSEFRVSNMRTQQELVDDQTVRERMLAMLSLFFATVALVLAGVGLYGVLDYAVVGGRRELGIRIALGARNGDIARRVTVEVFSMLVVGAVCGLALGLGSARYIATLLYQVKATDAPMLALPAITILSAALLAAVPPVLRAIHIDPSEMLRAE
jgi:putative ABC transport system permease protein